jgi:hypothetical protein
MAQRAVLLMFVLVGVVIIGSAFAAADTLPNDPKVNPNANACFAGGTLEGRCNGVDSNSDGVISDDEVAFAWRGGWYLIRFQAGMISRTDFPAQYVYLLPPLTQEAAQTFPQCFEASFGMDFELLAPYNTLNNARSWDSEDGSCSGNSPWTATLVIAPTQPEAVTLCTNIGVDPIIIDPSDESSQYPTMPANVWMCED